PYSAANPSTDSNTTKSEGQIKRAVTTETYAIPEEKISDPDPAATLAEQSQSWKKAMTLYSKKSYAEAIPFFKKVWRSDSSNKLLLTKLGDCYRLTNNTEGKLLCYGGLIRSGNA